MDAFAISTSLSLILLGSAMLWRKFDFYACFCIIIGSLGYFWPFMFVLPYFLVVWRVLIGRRVQTDQELFIGQHRDSQSESDTLGSSAHWIVAIKPEDEECYFVTHAVGEVISGRGKRIPFKSKPKDHIENEYHLYRVGWVTQKNREEHIQRVQENEPLASGYSCQEYAVDIAFQISSLRTYTFVKYMTLFRFRTVVYMLAVAISVFLYWFLRNEPEYSDIPGFFNFLSITHVFIATEAYRLGRTNFRQERDFWGGLKDRLVVYFRYIGYMDTFKLIVLFAFSAGVQIWMGNTILTVSIVVVAIIMAMG